MSEQYKEHPIAAIFPMIAGPEFEKLKADIKSHGFKESGLLFEGKILDGRNRYRASCELGIEMNWAEVENSEPEDIAAFDPVAYVLSQNLHRRHLQQSQRAMIAAKMATLKQGRPEKAPNGALTQAEAAKLLSVGEGSVDRAKYVLENGCKQLIDAVESCEIRVSMAEKLCKACDDKREQARLVKDGKDAIKLFLNPTPYEQPDADATGDDSEPDDYDYPVVKAFKVADYRLNTLKRIMGELQRHELDIVAGWLKDSQFGKEPTK
jgi:ParB-like chromosome segregation protein Spo0J